MKIKTIEIAKEFSDEPIGRYLEDSEFSGEVFRDTLLVPALNEYDQVVVILDGAEGYGSSFLEEAFGGLVRVKGFSKEDLLDHEKLVFISEEDATLTAEIIEYIKTAKPLSK